MVVPSLGNPWFWDDIHFVRSYSYRDLALAWAGWYDPDRIETPGFRPLLLLHTHLKFELLGESPDAHRWLTVATVALALTLLGVTLRLLGVPLVLAAAAGVTELTSKNFTYTYSMGTEQYHAFQMLTFGASLLALVAAAQRPRQRPSLLVTSGILWALTLLIKDQAMVLFPILAGTALLGGTLFEYERRRPSGEPSYSTLFATVRDRLRCSWRRRDTRLYVWWVVASTLLDAIGWRLVAPASNPTNLGSLVRQVVHTVSLGGAPYAVPYCVVAALAIATTMLAPCLPGRLRVGLAVPWLTALASLAAFACSIGFALAASRSDLVQFPLYFYATMLGAVLLLVLRTVWGRRHLRWIALAIVAAPCVASLHLSIRESANIQRAMGPWSVETVVFSHDLIYGELASAATIPEARRATEVARLRRAGVTGPLPWAELWTKLCARAAMDIDSPLVIPRRMAWGDDGILPCSSWLQ